MLNNTWDYLKHSENYKHKIFYNNTPNKEYKEIPYFYYCKKKFHFEERFWRKLKDLFIKVKTSNKKLNNQDNDTEFVITMYVTNQEKWILYSGYSQNVTNNLHLLYYR